MILFFALMATLNLCVGYVVGVYVGWLPGLVRPPVDEPAPPAMAELTVKASPLPRPAPAPAAQAAASQHQLIRAGLTAFRLRLGDLKTEADGAGDDGAQLDKCAESMQHEGQRFLDQANGSLAELAEHPDQDTPDHLLTNALARQTLDVEQFKNQLRRIPSATSTDEKRELLAESTAQLDASVTAFSRDLDKAEAVLQSPAAGTAEAADSGLTTIDQVLGLLASYFDLPDETTPLQVGAVRIDNDAERPCPDPQRLLEGVAEIVGTCLGKQQLAAIDSEGMLLVVMKDDGIVEGTDRLELVRRKVAASRFMTGEVAHGVTVSCALTDSVAFGDCPRLLAGLKATIEEASRFGTNRTFHHDGRLPAPVTPSAAKTPGLTIRL